MNSTVRSLAVIIWHTHTELIIIQRTMGLIIIQPSCCSELSAAVRIKESSRGIVSCPLCHKPIGTLISNVGYVYVLSSNAFAGTYKVGFTNRDIDERVNELNSSTSLPSPFEVEMFFLSTTARDEEIASHACLSNFRTNDRREFFNIPLIELHDRLCSTLKKAPIFISPSLKKALNARAKPRIIHTDVMQRVNMEIAKKLGQK